MHVIMQKLNPSEMEALEDARYIRFQSKDADVQDLERVVINGKDASAALAFAVQIADSDTKALEKVILQYGDATSAYWFARGVLGANIKELEKIVLSMKHDNLNTALSLIHDFALHVRGADVLALGQVIVEHGTSLDKFKFAASISGADKHALEESCIQANDPSVAHLFAQLEGANIEALKNLVIQHGTPLEAFQLADKIQKQSDTSDLAKMIIEHDDDYHAYWFATKVKDSNMKELEQVVLGRCNAKNAYLFARDVDGSDIEALGRIVREYGDDALKRSWDNDVVKMRDLDEELSPMMFG